MDNITEYIKNSLAAGDDIRLDTGSYACDALEPINCLGKTIRILGTNRQARPVINFTTDSGIILEDPQTLILRQVEYRGPGANTQARLGNEALMRVNYEKAENATIDVNGTFSRTGAAGLVTQTANQNLSPGVGRPIFAKIRANFIDSKCNITGVDRVDFRGMVTDPLAQNYTHFNDSQFVKIRGLVFVACTQIDFDVLLEFGFSNWFIANCERAEGVITSRNFGWTVHGTPAPERIVDMDTGKEFGFMKSAGKCDTLRGAGPYKFKVNVINPNLNIGNVSGFRVEATPGPTNNCHAEVFAPGCHVNMYDANNEGNKECFDHSISGVFKYLGVGPGCTVKDVICDAITVYRDEEDKYHEGVTMENVLTKEIRHV